MQFKPDYQSKFNCWHEDNFVEIGEVSFTNRFRLEKSHTQHGLKPSECKIEMHILLSYSVRVNAHASFLVICKDSISQRSANDFIWEMLWGWTVGFRNCCQWLRVEPACLHNLYKVINVWALWTEIKCPEKTAGLIKEIAWQLYKRFHSNIPRNTIVSRLNVTIRRKFQRYDNYNPPSNVPYCWPRAEIKP